MECDTTGDQFCLIEPSLTPPTTRGGGPGHDVEVRRSNTRRHESVDEEARQVVADLPTVAVFEPEYDVARPADERHGGEHLTVPRWNRRDGEHETARPTDDRAPAIAAGTAGIEKHARRSTPGV